MKKRSRKKDDVASAPVSLITVKSVPEEYEIIRRTGCRCGGSYQTDRQELQVTEDGSNRFLDVIFTHCLDCGKEREFRFDASEALKAAGELIRKDPTVRAIIEEMKKGSGFK